MPPIVQPRSSTWPIRPTAFYSDRHDAADLFAIPDLGMSPVLPQEPVPLPASEFFDITPDAPPSGYPRSLLSGNIFSPDAFEFFQWPKPDTAGVLPNEQAIHLRSVEPALLAEDAEDGREKSTSGLIGDAHLGWDIDESDIIDWLNLGSPRPPRPKSTQYLSWISFTSGRIIRPPLFLSESGSAVYNSLLDQVSQPLDRQDTPAPVVDTQAYCSSLLFLTLGRESVFFSRSLKPATEQGSERHFEPALPSIRISGYSAEILLSLQNQCSRCGSAFTTLRSFVQYAYLTLSSQCGVALASVVEKVLLGVEGIVSADLSRLPSLLQMENISREVWFILEPFDGLVRSLTPTSSDQDILQSVFELARVTDLQGGPLRNIMISLLRRVSRPWINFLEEWIGTRPEQGVPLTVEDVSQRKQFVTVVSHSLLADTGLETTDADFSIDQRNMPAFMCEDLMQDAFEAGRNLRFIKSCKPNHPLLSIGSLSTPVPSMDWLFDWKSVIHMDAQVVRYEADLDSAVREGTALQTRASSFRLDLSNLGTDHRFNIYGVDESMIEGQLLASMGELGSIPVCQHDDELIAIIRAQISRCEGPPIHTAHDTPHWALLPVLSFGSLITAQARIISRESLRLLFNTHGLREHLELLRAFVLLGNGMFCSRLTNALFSPDMDTAQRRAGVSLQGGGVMGLRLDGRESWPPASSELRLALAGMLEESHADARGLQTQRLESGVRVSALPGDLSFAIRDLPSKDIDKCLDPNSLQALDFLRLLYTPSPALRSVITPVILVRYDGIFRLLLRVLRMLYVVKQLFLHVNSRFTRWKSPGNVSHRFVIEATWFVSAVGDYFLGAAIAIPWAGFQSRLDAIQTDLDAPISAAAPAYNPDRIREDHQRVLDQITAALILRKRQRSARRLLEEIFGIVLEFAQSSRALAYASVSAPESWTLPGSLLYRPFRSKVELFVSACKAMADDRAGDSEGLRNLVTKVDWQRYYSPEQSSELDAV